MPRWFSCLFNVLHCEGRFTLRIIVFSTIIFGISLPVVNGLFVYPAFERVLVQGVKHDATLIASYLLLELSFSGGETDQTSLTLSDLVAISTMEEHFKLYKMKFYNKNRVAIYSTNTDDFGKINNDDYFREVMDSGESLARIVSSQDLSSEMEFVPVDVVEVYIPYMRGGQFIGALEIYYDVTERKQDLDRLALWSLLGTSALAIALVAAIVVFLRKQQQHLQLLEYTQNLRDDVERITQHDLKSPLANMLSGVNYLQTVDQNGENSKILEHMQVAGWRMMRMINSSLDLYKMETGNYQYQPSAVDLVLVLHEVMNELSGLALSKQVEMEFVVLSGANGSAVQFLVPAEEMLCHALAANLLKNALEATPRGGRVYIELRQDAKWHVIEVRNPGTLSPEVASDFFGKYVTAGKRGGTGLGTYSAKLITEAQGGTIELLLDNDMITVRVSFPVVEGFEVH